MFGFRLHWIHVTEEEKGKREMGSKVGREAGRVGEGRQKGGGRMRVVEECK